jgi:hypothetical protein
MVDKLRAINSLYPHAVSVKETEVTDTYIAKDENGNVIDVDDSLVNSWQDPEAYAFTRQSEYAPLKEQLDMMYHDKVNGTTTWEDHINSVKTNNPKPTE